MDVANQSRVVPEIKPAKRTRQQQEARIGLLFLAPWLIGFVILKALPILAALIFSLTDFKMLSPETTKFVGLENYIRFFGDSEAGASLFGSLGYFLLTVPLEMVVALALAAIFTSDRLKNKRISQTLIFMTAIIPSTRFHPTVRNSSRSARLTDSGRRLGCSGWQVVPQQASLVVASIGAFRGGPE